jgi:hypothetical protein
MANVLYWHRVLFFVTEIDSFDLEITVLFGWRKFNNRVPPRVSLKVNE